MGFSRNSVQRDVYASDDMTAHCTVQGAMQKAAQLQQDDPLFGMRDGDVDAILPGVKEGIGCLQFHQRIAVLQKLSSVAARMVSKLEPKLHAYHFGSLFKKLLNGALIDWDGVQPALQSQYVVGRAILRALQEPNEYVPPKVELIYPKEISA
jgi:hypothetical protein